MKGFSKNSKMFRTPGKEVENVSYRAVEKYAQYVEFHGKYFAPRAVPHAHFGVIQKCYMGISNTLIFCHFPQGSRRSKIKFLLQPS